MNNEIYDLIDDNCGEGFESKDEAYKEIRQGYVGIPGITAFCEDERWYIVQSKVMKDI